MALEISHIDSPFRDSRKVTGQSWLGRRPPGEARGGRILGVCNRRATKAGGMHRRPGLRGQFSGNPLAQRNRSDPFHAPGERPAERLASSDPPLKQNGVPAKRSSRPNPGGYPRPRRREPLRASAASRGRQGMAGGRWRQAHRAERALARSRLAGGVLVLRVASSVWAHELSLLSDVVCKRGFAGTRRIEAPCELPDFASAAFPPWTGPPSGASPARCRPSRPRSSRSWPVRSGTVPDGRPARGHRTRRLCQSRLADDCATRPGRTDHRSAASRSSPSRRCRRNRSAGPKDACLSRSCATKARRRTRSIALTFRNAL